MTNDDERIRGIFRRAFDDLRAQHAADPAHAEARTRRTFWNGPAGTATGAVVAAAVVALLAVALPGQRNAALKPVVPASEGGTVVPTEEPVTDATATVTPEPNDDPQSPPASPTAEPTGGTQPQPTPTASPRPTSRPSCHSDWAVRPKPPGLSVTLTASKTAARAGDLVTFTVTVRNDGPVPIDYQHGNPQSTVKVSGRNGDEWHSSDGKVYTQELRLDTLQPGESRSETHIWNVSSTACADEGAGRPTEPGTYDVTAAWHTSDGGWISNSITFTVR